MIVGALLQDKNTSHRRRGNYEFYNSQQQEKQKGLSGNLVGISINLCKSIQKELFINDAP